jgi:hypothetical protein
VDACTETRPVPSKSSYQAYIVRHFLSMRNLGLGGEVLLVDAKISPESAAEIRLQSPPRPDERVVSALSEARVIPGFSASRPFLAV